MLDFLPQNPHKEYLVKDVQELFEMMVQNKKSKGTVNTKKLMLKIKKLNQIFDNDDHHDSHEFLIWLINQIQEELQADINKDKQQQAQ